MDTAACRVVIVIVDVLDFTCLESLERRHKSLHGSGGGRRRCVG